jgi:hypothetical protein
MTESTDSPLDEILNKVYNDVEAFLKGEPIDLDKGETEAKQAIEAYTTNKIIEELEGLLEQDHLSWIATGIEGQSEHISYVFTNTIRDRIKALNHREPQP